MLHLLKNGDQRHTSTTCLHCKVDEAHPIVLNANLMRQSTSLTSVFQWRLVMAPPLTEERIGVCALWGVATPATVAIQLLTHQQHTLLLLQWDQQQPQFNTVTNKYYKMEVKMLRPGTVIPHPTTVSQESNTSMLNYLRWSDNILRWVSYFCHYSFLYNLVCRPKPPLFILQNMGWIAPHVASYLGIVVIWYEKGRFTEPSLNSQSTWFIIHKTTPSNSLFIEDWQKNMMASTWQKCSWPVLTIWPWRLCRSGFLNLSFPLWFVLSHSRTLHRQCGNCNTAYNLGVMLPHFCGTVSRTWSFPLYS